MKKGCLIAIFGTDGTGKSTVADLIEARYKALDLSTKRYHWRPRLLPSLKTNTAEMDVTCPDNLVLRPWIISLITYIYFFGDFFIANYLKIQPLIKKGEIILYERYYYDIMFHPRRYRSREIKMIVNLLTWMMPRPDLIVHLYGEPLIIQSRKPELSLDEISRQQTLMKQKLPKYGSVLSIDVTNMKPQNVADKIIGAVDLLQHEHDFG